MSWVDALLLNLRATRLCIPSREANMAQPVFLDGQILALPAASEQNRPALDLPCTQKNEPRSTWAHALFAYAAQAVRARIPNRTMRLAQGSPAKADGALMLMAGVTAKNTLFVQLMRMRALGAASLGKVTLAVPVLGVLSSNGFVW